MDRQLARYLPPFLRPVRDYKAVLDSEQAEIERLWDGCQKALGDQFIRTASEYGIGRWEKMLRISPRGTQTPDERRFAVSSRFMEALPFTLPLFRRALDALCGKDGYSFSVDGLTVTVALALANKSNFDDVAAFLERALPANLGVDILLKYNRHELLKPFRHEALQARTHNQIRNEVLLNG